MKPCNKCGGDIEKGNPLPVCLKCWDSFVKAKPVVRAPTLTEDLKKKLSPDYSKVASELIQKYGA